MSSPLLFIEEFEVVIMIEVVTEEMHGSDRVPDLSTDYERALVGMALISTRAKWRSSLSGWSSVEKKWKKVLDNAGIVREACSTVRPGMNNYAKTNLGFECLFVAE